VTVQFSWSSLKPVTCGLQFKRLQAVFKEAVDTYGSLTFLKKDSETEKQQALKNILILFLKVWKV